MALHRRKDFLKLCGGLPSNRLTIYISRGKVVESGDLFDDAIPLNAEFIRNQNKLATAKQKPDTSLAGKGKKKGIEKPISDKKTAPVYAEPVRKKEKEYSEEELDPNENKRKQYEIDYDLSQQKKELDLQKVEIEIRIARMREEKMRGEVIPVALMTQVFAQHASAINTEFKDFTEQFLNVIAKRKALSSQEVADIRGEMLGALNRSIDKAVDSTKKNMVTVVKDFSKTRDVGQHD